MSTTKPRPPRRDSLNGKSRAVTAVLQHAKPRQSPRFVTLSKRELLLAARAKERKRCALDLKLDEYEAALTLAEEFDESLAVILRSCFRIGLEQQQQFATKASGQSPFVNGDWQPRPARRDDPTGLRRPPPQDEIFTRGAIAAHLPPPKIERIIESNEPVFSEINLPQGATVYDERYEPEPAPSPMPIVEEVMSGDDIYIGPPEAKDPELMRRAAERVEPKLDAKRRRLDARNARVAAKAKQIQDAIPIEDENLFAPSVTESATLGFEEIQEAVFLGARAAVAQTVESDDPNDFL